ncbi:MAG: hypothetical protein RL375_1622, partial [Pseudomonadota bacterium]
MPAQSGSSILLSYGPQGSRQGGASVALNYSTPPRVRVTGGAVRAPWAASTPVGAALRATMPATGHLDTARAAPWSPRLKRESAARLPWGVSAAVDRARRAPWAYLGRALQPAASLPWGRSSQAEREVRAPWGAYGPPPLTEWATPWGRAAQADRARRVPWGTSRGLGGTDMQVPSPGSRSAGIVQWVPWTRYSRPLSPGWGVVVPPGPLPDPSGTFIVPILPVYIVINTTTLVRVDTSEALPALSVSLSLDTDSWTWTFGATLPITALASVQPVAGVPVELQATINGVPYRAIVEGIRRERTFGKDQIRISGRGVAAELAAPYSPVLTFGNAGAARTAQQLMGDVLSVSGIPLDWTVDWQITDWLVPADVWSMQGSRMDALNAIATAAGAVLQPAPSTRTLRVRSRYPVAPWDWAATAPAFELPAAVVQSEGIEWVSRPIYNRVFVSGQAGGILGQITRAGSAGDLVAPMVTDVLTTHLDAARQRALPILADTGRQALATIKLPVLDETGVIEPL